MPSDVPTSRIRVLRDAPPRRPARYVLYWMIAARRLTDNFGLQQAAWWSRELGLPLVVFEPLRVAYPWASDRLHAFVLQGMAEHRTAAAARGVRYYPYVEPTPALARACSSVSRRTRCCRDGRLPELLPAADGRRRRAAAGVRLEAVDCNGLVPMRATTTVYPTAYDFRRYLQKSLLAHLAEFPMRDPLDDLPAGPASIADDVLARWPEADRRFSGRTAALADLPIDHAVEPSPVSAAARLPRRRARALRRARLAVYDQERNQPDTDAARVSRRTCTSGTSARIASFPTS